MLFDRRNESLLSTSIVFSRLARKPRDQKGLERIVLKTVPLILEAVAVVFCAVKFRPVAFRIVRFKTAKRVEPQPSRPVRHACSVAVCANAEAQIN
jgi:hypothetical protein